MQVYNRPTPVRHRYGGKAANRLGGSNYVTRAVGAVARACAGANRASDMTHPATRSLSIYAYVYLYTFVHAQYNTYMYVQRGLDRLFSFAPRTSSPFLRFPALSVIQNGRSLRF